MKERPATTSMMVWMRKGKSISGGMVAVLLWILVSGLLSLGWIVAIEKREHVVRLKDGEKVVVLRS